MPIKRTDKTGGEGEFRRPVDGLSLRSIEGIGQKKLRMPKLFASMIDSINLHNKNISRSVHFFSNDNLAGDFERDQYFQHHLDYMTFLNIVIGSRSEETFCVFGHGIPTSNHLLRQFKTQIIESQNKNVQDVIVKTRKAIAEQQRLFPHSDVYNRLVLQDHAGHFFRPYFAFRSLKVASREWQKLNIEDMAKQLSQRKSANEPMVPGWGIQGFRSSAAGEPVRLAVHEWEASLPLSLGSLHELCVDLRKLAAELAGERQVEFYISCPYMVVSALVMANLINEFPKSKIRLDDFIYGWSDIHGLMSCLLSKTKVSVFLDLNRFPVLRAVVIEK